MNYAEFYDLAEYCNENWRGMFSCKETAICAYEYKVEYDAKGTESKVIKSLLEHLHEDAYEQGNGCEADEWIRRLTGYI